MTKSEYIALLQLKKDEKLASAAAEYDLLLEAANALDEVGSSDSVLVERVAELEALVALKDGEIASFKVLLSEVDQLAKDIDSKIS